MSQGEPYKMIQKMLGAPKRKCSYLGVWGFWNPEGGRRRMRRRRRTRRRRTVSPLLTVSKLFFPPDHKKIQFHPSALACPMMERIHLFNPADPLDGDREWTGKLKELCKRSVGANTSCTIPHWGAGLESTSGHWRGFFGSLEICFSGITEESWVQIPKVLQ